MKKELNGYVMRTREGKAKDATYITITMPNKEKIKATLYYDSGCYNFITLHLENKLLRRDGGKYIPVYIREDNCLTYDWDRKNAVGNYYFDEKKYSVPLGYDLNGFDMYVMRDYKEAIIINESITELFEMICQKVTEELILG